MDINCKVIQSKVGAKRMPRAGRHINMLNNIIKRNGTIVPFDQEKITRAIYKAAASVGGHDYTLSKTLSDEVTQFLKQSYPYPDMPLMEEVQDMVEKVLIENGHAQTAKSFILYRENRRKERQQQFRRHKKSSNIPYPTMYEMLVWNLENECESIEKLNHLVTNGQLPDLVRKADAAFSDKTLRAAEAIAKEKDRIKLVIIAGPSSSGKSTTTAKITQHLGNMGIEAVPLNIDHYFFDLEMHPKDEFGDYDFETPEALDLALINDHLSKLVNGETVKIPYYDFEAGRRRDNVTDVCVKPEQIILIDTLHGLYGQMTKSIPEDKKFKVYIETISQLKDMDGNFIRWTDIRLLRRMVRDMKFRGYSPTRTIGHWHYVRRSEMKHIIPYVNDVDFVINGALPYEFPFMKKYIYDQLPKIIKTWENNPKKQDALLRAKRIQKLLSNIEAYQNDGILSEDSLLREFIGGSNYKLH